MNIEIKGVEFTNKGAELMLLSIIQALDTHLTEYQLILSPGFLRPYQKRATLGAWQKFSFTRFGIDWTFLGNILPDRFMPLLTHFGIVRERDIDIVLDASGFIYSDQWPTENIYRTYCQIKRIKKFKTRYIFLPQTFGPFETKKIQKLMRNIIEDSDLILARDEISFDYLRKVKESGNTKLFPDITLNHISKHYQNVQLPNSFACIIPNSKVVTSEISRSKYVTFMERLINIFTELDISIVLLNHGGSKDSIICAEIIRRLQESPTYIDNLHAQEAKEVIAQSTLCISSRFHGCVTGLGHGIPTFATSWSHKYEQLYQSYGILDFVVAVEEEENTLKKKIQSALDNKTDIRRKLLEKTRSNQTELDNMWKLIISRIQLQK